MKKALCFIMALVMTVAVFCAVPFTESPFKITVQAASSGTCGTNLAWYLNNSGVLTISGTGAMTNYTTGSPAPWYSYRQQIKQIVINNGVTKIGSCAFYLCQNATSLSLPASVTDIFARAFYNCCNLTALSLPSNLVSVGTYAFSDCDKIISVIFPDTLVTIGEGAFKYCDKLSYIALGDKIKTIGAYAFNSCTKLINVYYAGSSSDWSEITLGSYNSSLNAAYIHYDVPTELAVCHYGCGTVTTLPTNSSVGISTYTCPCGHSYTKTTNCTGHNYTNQTTVRQPTCTKYGMARKLCCVCGEAVYLSSNAILINPEIYPETPHNYYNNMNENYIFYQKGVYKLILKFSSSTYVESSYDLIYIYNAAGSLVGTYTGSDLAGRTIEISGDHFSIKIKTDSSVTSYGFSLDEIIAYQISTDLNPLGHSYSSSWTTDSLSNCTQKGEKSRHCVRCNARTDITTLPLNTSLHSFSDEWTIDVPPTCQSTGEKSHHCVRCHLKKDVTVINPTAHHFSDWEVIKPATYTSLGQQVSTCDVCQSTEYAVIPKLICAAPKLSKITNESGGIKITWNSVTGAKSYRVYRKTTTGSWSMIAQNVTSTSYTDKTAKSGVSYKYTVRASSDGGLSDYNTNGLAIRRLITPKLNTAKSIKSGISLKWSKVTGATGYIIYRKTGSGSYTKLKTEKGVSNLSYTDKSAKKGKKYTYKVRAYYSTTSYSAYSGTKSVTDKY